MLLIGILSIVASIYCFILSVLHIIWCYKRLKNKMADQNQNPNSNQNEKDEDKDRLSIYSTMISMIFISICPLFLCLSYWIPMINNYCLCRLYFIITFICYSTSQYFSKFIYVHKGIILSKDYKISISIKICIFLLIMAYLASLLAIGTICDGDCTKYSDHNNYNNGKMKCIITINHSFYFYLSVLVLLIIDGLIYSKCCYEWYKAMKRLSNAGNFTNQIINQFMILFIGTTVITVMSIITVTTNAIWIDYNTLNIVIVDCILNSTLQIFIHNQGKNIKCNINKIQLRFINNINNISNMQNDDGINQSSPLSIGVMSANSTNVDNSADDLVANDNNSNNSEMIHYRYSNANKNNNLYPISEITDDDDESMTLFSEQ